MHELSIAQRIVTTASNCLGTVEKVNVKCVKVSVGAMAGVLPHALDTAYSELVRGTALEGSRLEQNVVNALLLCSSCGKKYEAESFSVKCPHCSSEQFSIIGGTDVVVESIEIYGD